MPHTDPDEACDLVARYLQIPAWPQLPRRDPKENMYLQFLDRFLGIDMEAWGSGDEASLIVDIGDQEKIIYGLSRLVKARQGNEIESGGFVTPDIAQGFDVFLKRGLEGKLDSPLAVKGQVIGPISLGLAVATDSDRRPMVYDDNLAEPLAMHLRLKAAWQENELSRLSRNTIIFVDEPYLASLGSAFISLPEQRVRDLLEEVLGGITGQKGVHCCGNTDWSLLLDTSIDILSLDAYNYAQTLSLYPAEVKSFLERGGAIAWGIVPNEAEALENEDEEAMAPLTRKGVRFEQLLKQSLITPSCGLAALSPEAASRALELLAKLSQRLRERYI
jgi:methionine synthase II (cobalamin-independent)